MTTKPPGMTGRPVEINRVRRGVMVGIQLVDMLRGTIAELAADDPDASETGELMSALLGLDMVSISLRDIAGDLSDAVHVCHTRLDG